MAAIPACRGRVNSPGLFFTYKEMTMQPFFFVRVEKRYEQVCFADIIYIKARRGYIQIVCEQQTFLVMNTLQTVMQLLPQGLFCRIHHSYIVSLHRIKTFDRTYVQLFAPPTGQSYKDGLARVTRLPVGGLDYRNQFRKSINLLKNRSGSHAKTQREAAYALEGEELHYELQAY